MFALQTENSDFCAEIMLLRAQFENADRLARRWEREIRGLRWLVINWGSDKRIRLVLLQPPSGVRVVILLSLRRRYRWPYVLPRGEDDGRGADITTSTAKSHALSTAETIH